MPSASQALAQGLQRATVTRSLAAGPDRFKGGSRYNNLSPSGRLSGVLAAGEGPTAMVLKGSGQFRESFFLRTLVPASLRSPCRMVAVVLYTQVQPSAAYLRRRRRVSERAKLRPFTPVTLRACCLRTSS